MILRVLVCIPAYNNSRTLEQVIADVLSETELGVLVVDDGSDAPVRDGLRMPLLRQALRSGRLSVLRHQRNRGKGAALQSGFEWAAQGGFTHVLSVDADGQHLMREAAKLLNEAVAHPWDMIIGKRRLESREVPGVSKFGRAFSNFWVRYQTSVRITDSRSGFRLYPLFPLQMWRFWTRHFDFEIEVLIRLLWAGVSVREVDVEVYDPPPDQRVSHVQKFWDNCRISFLNTVLVVLSLIKANSNPRSQAAAFGLGLFIGASPLFGLQTLLAVVAAFAFRLNFPLLVLGTQISWPPVAVLIIPAEVAVGRMLLSALGRSRSEWVPAGRSLNELVSFASRHFLEWGLGSLAVGAVLGLAGAYIAERLLRSAWSSSLRSSSESDFNSDFNSKSGDKVHKLNWSGETRGGRLGNSFLKWWIGTFALRSGYFLLLAVVPYYYFFAPRARRSAAEYWRVLRPRGGFWFRQWFVLKQFHRFGQVLMDRAYQAGRAEPQFVTKAHGLANLETALAADSPIIFVSAHVGGWEMAARTFKQNSQSGQALNMVHFRDETALEIKRRLEEGEMVGMMADRPSAHNVELVSFFGRIVPFDTRPFRVAAACTSQIMFAFGLKGKGNEYDLFLRPAFKVPRSPEAGNGDSAYARAMSMRDGVEAYARSLELVLVRHPEQWFNFFTLFSSRPQSSHKRASGTEQHHLWREWPRSVSPVFGWEAVAEDNGEPPLHT